ncbi:hypothetical protein ACH4UM_41630 [Streptomyces sp. NPDC020801]|uniref:hypothetical protein n=1 Tax=Streptomyces sp. NPDC020801 TaxID=3365093 RepID=UPI0037950258
MSTLPTWLRSQITAAQAEAGADGTTWSVYVATDGGLVLLAGAHDRDHAQRWLDESGKTGLVARSPKASANVSPALSGPIALGGTA